MALTLLDGAMGTELEARGLVLPPPAWTASAVSTNAAAVRALHEAYARAGAEVLTAMTFRTTARAIGRAWRSRVAAAVALARAGAAASGKSTRVAGSLAPLEDCYRPDLTPDDDAAVRREHGALARALVDEGVDVLLCETFTNGREARLAAEACGAMGLEFWVALSAGPDGRLMSPAAMREAATACVAAGASALLVNCVAAELTLPFVEALAGLGVPFGAYANGGLRVDPSASDASYVHHASTWVAAGATRVGGCCGTTPATTAALARWAHALQRPPVESGDHHEPEHQHGGASRRFGPFSER